MRSTLALRCLASTTALLLTSMAALPGCGTDGQGAPPPVDAGPPPPDLFKVWPPPLAPAAMPEPLLPATWFTTEVSSGFSDPVITAIESGKFAVTQEGMLFGTDWWEASADENGSVGASAGQGRMFYAAALVDVPAGKHVFARVDAYSAAFANGAEQPGDVYASGAMRVPLISTAGERNTFVFRVTQPRGDPQAQLFATSDEVYFNLRDVTAFDPLVGATDEQWLGVAVLNLTDAAADGLIAAVEESDLVQASQVSYPALPPGAVTKVAFRVTPKAGWPAEGTKVTVGLRVLSPALALQYRAEVTLTTVGPGKTYRRSFRSGVDRSAQYYGVVPPSNFDSKKSYAMVLTLHGAGVEGIGQAQAYAPKDYAYVVAATNRRPFGFDWEEWGRSDAIEVLESAQARFQTDPTQAYLTGHSMGGHGTWNVGVLFPGRFALIGPSAGWGSFYSYTGQPMPTGAFARSQASSDTSAYLRNLARRGAYVIHGTADDNVPIREARALVAALKQYTPDVQVHEEPGAGHWWSSKVTLGGASCVDWPDLFADMQAHRLDPTELEFDFTTPLPSVNAQHSFVTVRSQQDFTADARVVSARTLDGVALTTTNVRSLVLDGKALRARGVSKVTVDGAPLDVPDGALPVGPEDGKRPGAYGPFNDALRRPFCFVYADDGAAAYRRYAGYLTSVWAIIGNGQACALPLSKLTDGVRADYQIIYLGVRPAALDTLGWPMSWGEGGVTVGAQAYPGGVLYAAFPEGDKLAAVIAAGPGNEQYVFHYQPFHSGFAVPDYMVYGAAGVKTSGFVAADWKWR